MAVEGEVRLENMKNLKKDIGIQPLRFVTIFFSIILTLYGAAILLATLTVKVQLADYSPFLDYYLNIPVLVLIIGAIISMALGCTGIITTALTIYQGIVAFGVLSFGLFMFEITMATVFFFLLNSADLSVIEALDNHVNNYTQYNDSMDFIQTSLNCCGKNDFTDWNSTLGYVPGSCCNSDSPCGLVDIMSLNTSGCYDSLKSLINYLIYYLAIILGVLAAIQITTMIITFFLVRGLTDCRSGISRIDNSDDNGNNDVGKLSEETAGIVVHEIKNPLGILKKNENNDFLMRKVSVDSTSRDYNSSPNRKNSFDLQNVSGQLPADGKKQRVRNPLHDKTREYLARRNNINNYTNSNENLNDSRKHSPQNVSHLPRPHRKFPINF